MQTAPRTAVVVTLSLIVAMALRILPLPAPWFMFNPDWVALFLIYWTLALPERVGIGTAWLTGLFADVLTGRLLGQHALAYAVISYIIQRSYRRLRLFPLAQQALWILVLLLGSQVLVFWTEGNRPPDIDAWFYWLPAMSGGLIWPLVLFVLRRLRRAYRIV